MKAQSTPGPWKFVKGTLSEVYAHVVSESGFFIAACPDTIQQTGVSHPVTDKEAEANARLISCAPIGAELVKMILMTPHPYFGKAVLQWDAIVSKALELQAKLEGR